MNTSSGESPYVLFVDDEEMTRKTFERIASQEFPVLLAADVTEAIEVLERNGDQIGVLLTDQRMPGRLGVELLEYAREEHPAVVRMLTTAYSELEDAIAAVNRGEIIRYIEKPWNNIDALLIDLRVAMRFHVLERSNQQLMSEKMSAKSRAARLDRLQVLAALAASQPKPEMALIGLEVALRRLSDLRSEESAESGTNAGEFYSGPIEELNLATQLAQRCSQPLSDSKGESWGEVSPIAVEGDSANQEFPADLIGQGAELVARAFALFSAENKSELKCSAISTSKGVDFTIEQKTGTNSDLSRWLNLGSDKDSVKAVADFLKLHFIAYSHGLKLEFEFEDQTKITKLIIHYSDAGNSLPSQDADWFEDILILLA